MVKIGATTFKAVPPKVNKVLRIKKRWSVCMEFIL